MSNAQQTNGNTQVTNVERTRAEGLERGPVLTPAVDVFENDDQVLLLADLPGVGPDGLSVEFDKDLLKIEAKRPWKTPDGEAVTVTYRRSFNVSPQIDADRVSANLDNGVLRVELPKHAAVRRRRIPIQG